MTVGTLNTGENHTVSVLKEFSLAVKKHMQKN